MDSVTFQKPSVVTGVSGVTGAAGTGAKTAVSGKTAGQEDDQKLRKACASFESFMIYYMLKAMRQSVPQDGLFGKMPGKDTFNMMLDQKIAEKAAERKGGSLGLQKILYDQLSGGGQRKYGKTGSTAGPTTTAVNVKN